MRCREQVVQLHSGICTCWAKVIIRKLVMGSINQFNASELIFFVNGKKVVEEKPNPEWTLLYYLRHKLRLVGSKEGCGEGGCGACTVMQSRFDPESKTIINQAVNACLTPLCSVHGTAIVTVEGLGSVQKGLHPVQERIAKSHGTQCGFCTPGFVMSMYALLRNNEKPDEKEMEQAFQGNLCRCTGYRPILDGFKTFCKDKTTSDCNGVGPNGKCCKAYDVSATAQEVTDVLFDESEFAPYDSTVDIIFPSELQLNPSLKSESLLFTGPNVTWYKPSSIEQLIDLKRKHPMAKIMAGNTELGVDLKFKDVVYPVLIHVSDIPELSEIKMESDFVNLGAAATLSKLDTFCRLQIKLDERKNGTVFTAVREMLRWFGGQQVRNVATAGGNLITASPIADLNPIWMAVGADAKVLSVDGTTSIAISSMFFKSYRRTAIAPNEVLHSIHFPKTSEYEFVWSAKQARRKEDDISIVTSCMRVQFDPDSCVVKDAILVFGGMAPVTSMAKKASKCLIGKKWNKGMVQEVVTLLQTDFPLAPGTPGGMVAYRMSLVSSMFFKFFLTVSNWLVKKGWTTSENLFDPEELSALDECTTGDTKSAQLYQIVPKEQKVHDLIGRPVLHLSGLKHATGEAEYTDDIPQVQGELFGCLVLSKIARGTILSIDPSPALAVPGVVEYFDAKSIPPERNVQGIMVQDEEVFASKEVTCQGQVIGYIVATEPQIAEKAAKLVKVIYDEKIPIVTIEQAIEQESYYTKKHLTSGDVDKAFAQCDKIIEGEMRTGGQEHFYMETQSCLVSPKEDGELHVQVSSQALNYKQTTVARVLGLKSHKVKVTCRRMGGAFGGKESRSVLVTVPTTIAAQKLRVPVRTIMNRQDDMVATGGRNPFLCRYKVGFNNDGRITAVKASLYANAGNSLDASMFVVEKAVLMLDSGYTIPNWDLTGYVCKTNLPSNTAFRGFGAPQATLFCEDIIDSVAETLGKPAFEIRQMHLKQEGHVTPCGWKLENVTVQRCWDECVQNSEYFSRLKQVQEFNEKNRWKKRGIAIMPTKHDLGFHATFMNQGGALVMIYMDGSVGLNFGGVEMGQGLITKMIQVASRALDIPAELIYFNECSTDKVPNAIATCASMSSDLNGMAIIDACEKLNKRLEPFKQKNPNGTWENWVEAAFFNRVSLSATGFYEMGHLNYDFENPTMNVGKQPANYCAYGSACTEVEIDCLTGDMSILRTDIVMDAGESLNPAVDIGQIEGAFIQGFGLVCLEELLYTPKGLMLTKGPGMYKIPALCDIPRQFYVSLLRGAPNPKAVYSSKGLGEPPLLLATSIYLAVKEAIKSFRKENGHSTLFRFDCPATVERIRMTCQGPLAMEQESNNTDKTWAVRP